MHFLTLLSAAAALMAGANAVVIPRNTHVADFRLYGAPGCYDVNLGVWTVIDDDFTNGECKPGFNGAKNVQSLSLVDIIEGCTLRAYPDESCGYGGQVLNVGECANAEHEWKAWSMECTYKA